MRKNHFGRHCTTSNCQSMVPRPGNTNDRVSRSKYGMVEGAKSRQFKTAWHAAYAKAMGVVSTGFMCSRWTMMPRVLESRTNPSAYAVPKPIAAKSCPEESSWTPSSSVTNGCPSTRDTADSVMSAKTAQPPICSARRNDPVGTAGMIDLCLPTFADGRRRASLEWLLSTKVHCNRRGSGVTILRRPGLLPGSTPSTTTAPGTAPIHCWSATRVAAELRKSPRLM